MPRVMSADMLELLRRRDIDGASAAFWILQAHWTEEGGRKVRVIDRARLIDASVTAMPAYPETSANVIPVDIGALRAKLDRLRSDPPRAARKDGPLTLEEARRIHDAACSKRI